MEGKHLALVLALGLVLGAMLVRQLHRLADRRQRQRISRRAQRGESDAEALLRRHGYTVLAAQVRRPVRMTIDGTLAESIVIADYLAAKGARRYLVEVKTGQQADPTLPHVRRQLYEYQHLFATDGILFLDMNTRTIRTIAFPDTRPQPAWGAFLGGLGCGIVLMILLTSIH